MSNEGASSGKCQDNHTCKCKSKNYCNPCGSSCAIYGLGVVGAIFYYVQTAPSFVEGIVGFIKAFFWPAILMYELLMYLKL